MVSKVRSSGQPFQMLLLVLSGHPSLCMPLEAFTTGIPHTGIMKIKRPVLLRYSVSIIYKDTWESFCYLNTVKFALI